MDESKAHDLYVLFKHTDAAAKQKKGLGFGGGFGAVNDSNYNRDGPTKAYGTTLNQTFVKEETAAPASWLAKKLAERKQAQSAASTFQAGYQQALAAAQAQQAQAAAVSRPPAAASQEPPQQRRGSPDYGSKPRRGSPDYGPQRRRSSPDYGEPGSKHSSREREEHSKQGRSSREREQHDRKGGSARDRGGSEREQGHRSSSREVQRGSSRDDKGYERHHSSSAARESGRDRRGDDRYGSSRDDRHGSSRDARYGSGSDRYGDRHDRHVRYDRHHDSSKDRHRDSSSRDRRDGAEGRHSGSKRSREEQQEQQRSSRRRQQDGSGSSREARDPGRHIPGYHRMTPAERLRAQRQAALQEADKVADERSGPLDERGWTRQVFNSYAPLQEEQGVAAVDRPALADPLRGLDERDELPASRDALVERRVQQADKDHEAAIFGASKAGKAGEQEQRQRAAAAGAGLGLGYASDDDQATEDDADAGEHGQGQGQGGQQGRQQERQHAQQQLALPYGDDDDEDGPVVVSLPSSPAAADGAGEVQQQVQPDKDLAAEVVSSQGLDWRQKAALARQRRAA